MFVDTHCHIEKENAEDYVRNANLSGVSKIITASEDYASSLMAVEIAKAYEGVFACIGVHPENVNEFNDEDIDKFKELLKNNEVKAIGEIGLDYHYGKETRDRQIEVFKVFLSLAEEYNLPVVIHSRDAIEDTIKVLKDYNVVGVMHCFSGSYETAMEYIKLGYSLGIGGVLTFKNSKLYETVKRLPLEKIVLETDSPFLTPEPYRGTPNESKYIPLIAECLAGHLDLSIEAVAEQTTSNACLIFDI